MTVVTAGLILAIHRLDTVRNDLEVLLTLTDETGESRQEMAPADMRRRVGGITEREHQLLALLGEGLTNAEIAARAVISESTVKGALSNVYRKLHVHDRFQAALLAHSVELIHELAPAIVQRINKNPHPPLTRSSLQPGPKSRLGINPNMPRPLSQR